MEISIYCSKILRGAFGAIILYLINEGREGYGSIFLQIRYSKLAILPNGNSCQKL